MKHRKHHTEDGGISCGICRTSLQQATFGFGAGDMLHGIIGACVALSMLLTKETDKLYPNQRVTQNRESGYIKFLRDSVEFWFLYYLVGGFLLQIAVGLLACLGAIFRNSTLCSLWIISTVFTAPFSPMFYCLLGIGRIYQWITVGEFVWKMDEEEETMFAIRKDQLMDKFVICDPYGFANDKVENE